MLVRIVATGPAAYMAARAVGDAARREAGSVLQGISSRNRKSEPRLYLVLRCHMFSRIPGCLRMLPSTYNHLWRGVRK